VSRGFPKCGHDNFRFILTTHLRSSPPLLLEHFG
jgi:hypothetical protein